MLRPRPRRLLTALCAAVAAACASPATPALAAPPYVPLGDECELIGSPLFAPLGQALTDPAGFTVAMGAGSSGGYATLWDGGTGPLPADTWNGFGQLYVGATASNASAYTDGNAHGCARSVSGRSVDFATVTRGALQIRRSMLVPASTGSGVRIVDAVTNTSGAPVTTNVWVGDLLNGHADGVGSDGSTTIRATSSGDTTLSTADLWAVTTDQRQNTLADPSDPALAHVWGGPGAEHPIGVVRSGAQPGDVPLDNPNGTLAAKQLGWGWEQVTLAAGETARFLSWEIPRQAGSRSWVDQAPLAEQAAEDLLDAPLSNRYQGMSPAEIATVRNWAPPAVDGAIAPVTGATTTTDTALQATGVDFGADELAACTSGTVRWDFGDGATATGASVTHRFSAGTANVTLTIEGTCGGRTTRTLSFPVATPTPSPTPTPAPTNPLPTPTPEPGVPADARDVGDRNAAPPAGPTLKLYGPPSVKTTTLASSHGLVVGVRASVEGEVRLVLTGTGVKSVKSAPVKANETTFVKVQLDRSARPVALTLKSIRLRAKLVPRGGGEIVENLFLKLRR